MDLLGSVSDRYGAGSELGTQVVLESKYHRASVEPPQFMLGLL